MNSLHPGVQHQRFRTFAQSSSANENLLGISIAQRSGNVNEEVVKMDVSDEPSVIVCEDEPRKKNPVAGLAPNESLKSSSVFTVKPLTVRKDLFGPVAPGSISSKQHRHVDFRETNSERGYVNVKGRRRRTISKKVEG